MWAYRQATEWKGNTRVLVLVLSKGIHRVVPCEQTNNDCLGCKGTFLSSLVRRWCFFFFFSLLSLQESRVVLSDLNLLEL